jgi:hypothetical protein
VNAFTGIHTEGAPLMGVEIFRWRSTEMLQVCTSEGGYSGEREVIKAAQSDEQELNGHDRDMLAVG